jgi:chloramphenicol 3-O-phosphotransferase
LIVLLNGAFGVGKTTVGRMLVGRSPGAVLYDPEIIGIALQRAARLFGRNVADFQDLRLWRRLTVVALRVLRLFRRIIIVPMAFSNTTYLQEIRTGIHRFEPCEAHFCLVAPIEIIRERQQNRPANAIDAAWQDRRATECCAVHHEKAFALQINAANRKPNEIADEIWEELQKVRNGVLPL